MPAGKGVDMSELHAQHCMTPVQWIWRLRSVSVVPANKLLLQEINQLIGIELLTSNFLDVLVLIPNFQRGENARFGPGADSVNKVKGAISAIFVSQVSLRVHYFKMKYTYNTSVAKQWISGGAIALIAPPGFAPVLTPLWTPMALTYHEFKTVCLSSV